MVGGKFWYISMSPLSKRDYHVLYVIISISNSIEGSVPLENQGPATVEALLC